MKQLLNYRSAVGLITVLSGILSALCIWVGSKAVSFNFEAFSNPVLVLRYSSNYHQHYWFMLLDLVGYYLLLLPVILYMHQQYKQRSPWISLFTFSGLSYVLIGAIGSVILAALWPELMQNYMATTGQTQEMVTRVFTAVTLLVTKGLWNTLEVLFAAIWWIGIGTVLYKEHKAIGIITILTGISALLDSAGNIVGNNFIAATGLNVYLVLGITWPFVIGIYVIKKATPKQRITSSHENLSTAKSYSYENV